MDVLSHPFRLGPDGSAVTVLDGGPDANAEAVAVLAMTRKGERVLVPSFGITDPAFAEVDPAELNAGLATFGPEDVTVTGVEVTYPNDRTADVTVVYEEA